MKSALLKVITLISCITGAAHVAAAPSTLPLAGTWQFSLNRGNVGENECWFKRTLAENIELPAAWSGKRMELFLDR